MHGRYIQILVATAGFWFCTAPHAADSTSAGTTPTGFRVVQLESGKCRTLQPDGWVRRGGPAPSGEALFITAMPYTEDEASFIGLDLQVQNKALKKPTTISDDLTSLVYSELHGEKLLGSDVIAFAAPSRTASTLLYRYIVRQRFHSRPIVVYRTRLADETTASSIWVEFQAPEERWAEAWKLGRIMLDALTCRGVNAKF